MLPQTEFPEEELYSRPRKMSDGLRTQFTGGTPQPRPRGSSDSAFVDLEAAGGPARASGLSSPQAQQYSPTSGQPRDNVDLLANANDGIVPKCVFNNDLGDDAPSPIVANSRGRVMGAIERARREATPPRTTDYFPQDEFPNYRAGASPVVTPGHSNRRELPPKRGWFLEGEVGFWRRFDSGPAVGN